MGINKNIMASKLVKSKRKVIAGICGGIANYIGWDPVWVRILFIIFTIATALVAGLLVYAVLWIAMPDEA